MKGCAFDADKNPELFSLRNEQTLTSTRDLTFKSENRMGRGHLRNAQINCLGHSFIHSFIWAIMWSAEWDYGIH